MFASDGSKRPNYIAELIATSFECQETRSGDPIRAKPSARGLSEPEIRADAMSRAELCEVVPILILEGRADRGYSIVRSFMLVSIRKD